MHGGKEHVAVEFVRVLGHSVIRVCIPNILLGFDLQKGLAVICKAQRSRDSFDNFNTVVPCPRAGTGALRFLHRSTVPALSCFELLECALSLSVTP